MSAKSSRVQRFGALASVITVFAFCLTALASAPVGHNHRWHSRHMRHLASRSVKTPKLRLLKFKDAARLAFRQRVRYVHLLREAVAQAEREQIAFHSAHATAMNDRHSRDLFAMLFMPQANADGNGCLPGDPCDLAGRGLNCHDQCIYGGFMSSYPQCGAQQPFQCKRAAKCSAGGGELCNPVVYGSLDDECVPSHEEYRATQECYNRMKNKASSIQAEGRYTANASRSFFKLDQCALSASNPTCNAGKLTEAQAESTNARQWIDNLVSYSSSDEDYAELIGVVELYKKNGWDIPTTQYDYDTLSDLNNKLDPKKFENSLNSVAEGVEEIFAQQEAHCNQHLMPAVCNAIQNYKPGDYGVHRQVLIDREVDRQGKLAGVGCANATVRNVLESDECVQLDKKIESLNDQAVPIRSSLPPTPPPPPPTPAPHEVDQSYGCSSVFRDNSGLFQPAAQCSVCLSENTANRYGYQLDELASLSTGKVKQNLQKEAARFENYTDSTRWKTLLSTMALVCGDSINGAHDVTAETMAHYVEAFGQCDAKTYDWPDDPSSDPDLLKEIADVTSKSPVDDKPAKEGWKKLFKNIDKNFQDLFGADITQLIPLFCNSDRFKQRWLGLSYKGNLSENWQGSGIDWSSDSAIKGFKALARQHFSPENVKKIKCSGASAGDCNELKECMTQAIDYREKLYPDNEICLSTEHPSAASDFVSLPRDALNSMSAAVIDDGDNCFISSAHSSYKGQEGWLYAKPSTVSDPTLQADPNSGKTIFMPLWKTPGDYTDPKRPNLATYACDQSDSNCQFDRFTALDLRLGRGIDTVIYENSNCRPPAEPPAKITHPDKITQ